MSLSIKFLKALVESIGPSGYEAETARIWRDEAQTVAEEVATDLHGNTHAVINKGGAPRVMLAGHVDEIGFQVTYIDDKGFLSFAAIGGWDPQIPQGHRVWVNSAGGRLLGVVGKKPIHLMKDSDRKKVVKLEAMWIDIGATTKEEAEELVAIGDPVVLAWGFEHLRGDLLVSKSFDDRVGAFVALETLRKTKDLGVQAEVWAVATVQEEIGLRGARTAAYGVDPDVGIAIDVTHATDYPGMGDSKKKIGDIRLGKGPVVFRGANVNPRLHSLLASTGKDEKIPYQVRAFPRGTGTDGNAIQLNRSGVATAVVSIPNRYMHSPCEIVHRGDLEAAVSLLAKTIRRMESRDQFVPF